MADADFGYVGGAPGKVDLYVGKEVVRRGIPNEEACDGLVEVCVGVRMRASVHVSLPTVKFCECLFSLSRVRARTHTHPRTHTHTHTQLIKEYGMWKEKEEEEEVGAPVEELVTA